MREFLFLGVQFCRVFVLKGNFEGHVCGHFFFPPKFGQHLTSLSTWRRWRYMEPTDPRFGTIGTLYGKEFHFWMAFSWSKKINPSQNAKISWGVVLTAFATHLSQDPICFSAACGRPYIYASHDAEIFKLRMRCVCIEIINCSCTPSLFLSSHFTVFLGGCSLSCRTPARTTSR